LKLYKTQAAGLVAKNRKGEHNIRVNKQWRICFKWNAGHASGVEITDYR